MIDQRQQHGLTDAIVRRSVLQLTTEGMEVYEELGNLAADLVAGDITQQEARIGSEVAVSRLDVLPPSDREHIIRMVRFQAGSTAN